MDYICKIISALWELLNSWRAELLKLFELKVLAWLEQGCWVVMDVFILERRQLPAGRRCSIRKHEVRQKPEPAPSSSIQIQHSDDDMNIELAFGKWEQQKQIRAGLKKSRWSKNNHCYTYDHNRFTDSSNEIVVK